MPLYEVRSLDVWGNAAEGFEVNDSFRAGEIYIPPEADPIPLLVEAGFLEQLALQADSGVDFDVGDNTIEITELDREIAVASRHGDRWLEFPGTLEEAQEEARVGNLELQAGESPEDIYWSESLRPLYTLETDAPFTSDVEGTEFWRTRVRIPAMPGNMMPDEHDLDIVLGYDSNETNSTVSIVGVDPAAPRRAGEVGPVDRFIWYLGDWLKKPSFGFDPLTREELVPTGRQITEIQVALDAFMEHR